MPIIGGTQVNAKTNMQKKDLNINFETLLHSIEIYGTVYDKNNNILGDIFDLCSKAIAQWQAILNRFEINSI